MLKFLPRLPKFVRPLSSAEIEDLESLVVRNKLDNEHLKTLESIKLNVGQFRMAVESALAGGGIVCFTGFSPFIIVPLCAIANKLRKNIVERRVAQRIDKAQYSLSDNL